MCILVTLACPVPRSVIENGQESRAIACIPPNTAAENYLYLNQFGSYGTEDGQFKGLGAIAVNASGYIYVPDSGNNRVQVFTQTGQFVTKWGIFGTGDGQFNNYLDGIAINASGHVYVADSASHRLQVFTQTGQFVAKWGAFGTGDGQFSWPSGIATNATGYLYVTDPGNNRVQVFTQTGQFVTKWGASGTGDGQFDYPSYITVNASGHVFVADANNHRVQVFTQTGQFVTKWGSSGTEDGQFNSPRGIAVDTMGHVIVADADNHRVQVFTQTGQFLTTWGSYGSGDGQFDRPSGIAVNATRQVYVTDMNSRVQVFEPDVYPPEFGEIIESADPLELGATVWVQENVTDPSNVSAVLLERDGVNYTMNYEGGNWWNTSWVPGSGGQNPYPIDYTIWANDTCGNWGSTTGTLIVTDTTEPDVTFIEDSDPLELGDAPWVHANFSDLSSIASTVYFEFDHTNYSLSYDTQLKLYVSPLFDLPELKTYDYAIWAPDRWNNMRLVNGSITVMNTAPPLIFALEDSDDHDQPELGDSIWVRTNITDFTDVNTVYLERGGMNYTMIHQGGDTWNMSWTPIYAGKIDYTIWANDSDGIWGNKTGTITVLDTAAPVVTDATDILVTTPVAEGHFPAKYTFTSDEVGNPPADFTPYSPTNASCRVNDSYAGHAQVLVLTDWNNIDYCGARVTFAGLEAGAIECYLAVTAWGGENRLDMILENGTGVSKLSLSLHGGDLELWNLSSTITLATGLNAGEFYHVRVAFDCVAGTCQVWLNGSDVGTWLFDGLAQGQVAGVSFRTSVPRFGADPYSGCVDAVDFSWDFSYEAWRGLPHVAWNVTDACTPDMVLWNVTRNGVLWRTGTGFGTGIVPVGSVASGDVVLIFNVTDLYNRAGDPMIVRVNLMPLISIETSLVEYFYGDTGHFIYWTITDREVNATRLYTIYKNGTPWNYVNLTWANNTAIPLGVDGFGYGDHAIRLAATDGYGGQNSRTVIVRVWDPYTNGTWQDIRVGQQVINCTRWGVTYAELDLVGIGPDMMIQVTAFLPGTFPVAFGGAVAYFEVALAGSESEPRWPATGRFYYDPSLAGTAGEENLALYRLEGNTWGLVEGARVNVDGHFVVADFPGEGEYVIAPGPVTLDPTAVVIVSGVSAVSLGAIAFVQRKGILVIWRRRRAVQRALASLEQESPAGQWYPVRKGAHGQ